jgi:hypothetical protein
MNPWNFFDCIYCVNLEKDEDRYNKAVYIFKHYDIPVTFFKGILDNIGNKGCLESHKAIYNLALSKGYNKILIFEDDIIPTLQINTKNILYYTDFLKNNNWDIFYFGAMPDCFSYSQKQVGVPNIYKIRGICTHAYALNKNAMEKLKDIEYTPEAPLDYIIKKDEELNSFAAYPSLFYQKTNYNLPESIIILGLKLNEIYAYHLGIPVKFILIGVVIVSIFFFLNRLKKIFLSKYKNGPQL